MTIQNRILNQKLISQPNIARILTMHAALTGFKNIFSPAADGYTNLNSFSIYKSNKMGFIKLF